jgi:hypothetical protein
MVNEGSLVPISFLNPLLKIGATTVSRMTLGIKTHSIKKLSKKTHSIKTVSIKTLSIKTEHKDRGIKTEA